MAKFDLSAEADADLDGIATFGALQYGFSAAARYVDVLQRSLVLCASFPQSAPIYETDLGRTYRRRDIRSHAAFYREREDHIFVVRILHQSMDFDRYL